MNIKDVPRESMMQSLRLIRDEILARGWSGDMPYENTSHVRLKRPDGKALEIYSSTPPTTSYAAAHMADDKYAAYMRISEEKAAVQLDSALVTQADYREIGKEWLQKYGKLAVKPVDGAHGLGVTTSVSSLDELDAAFELALSHTKRQSVLIQRRYPADSIVELRVLCIDHRMVGALYRRPARVIGDGVHTIEELIEQENQRPERGVPYRARLALISLEDARQYLGADRMAEVLAAGEEASVLGVANYGAGGEIVDVTKQVPDWLARQAVNVSKVMGLPVVGVDFIVKAAPRREATEDELAAVVLEINKCPSLGIHVNPTTGDAQPVVAAYVDYLEKI